MTLEAVSAPGGVGPLQQDVVDFLEHGVVVLDDALAIVAWNRWMEEVAGRSRDSVAGRSLLDVFPELAGSQRATALDRALNGEVVVLSHRFHEYFLPLPPPPGFPEVPRMQQSARVAPRMQAGRVVGVVVLIQDVTERTVRESELRVALERAEIANRAKADFLSSMSHELRTPLNVILGYSDLLTDQIGGKINVAQRKKIDRIKQAVWHLLAIIDEILTFSRVEAGKETVKAEPVELVAILRDTVVMLQNEAHGRGLGLDMVVDRESLTIVSDARRIRQILLNLMSNALKFTQQGGVQVTLDASGDHIAVHVTDSGPGIEPGRLSEIFEPFTRIAAHDGPSGTGLGLPLSKRLAELLGGDVVVRSERGKGSTFTLVLPCPDAASRNA